MNIQFFNINITIPEVMIEKYCKEMEPMLQWENRKSLERLRDAMNDILFVVADHPKLLANSENYGNFVKSLAIRVALSKLRILYDD
jgi:hypothetical protein